MAALDTRNEEILRNHNIDPCEVCSIEQAKTYPSNLDGVHQECPRCGEFKISGTAGSILRGGKGKEARAKLSGWVREQNLLGAVPLITSDNMESVFARPLPSVADRALSILQEAERGTTNLGDRFNINDPRFLAASYSSDHADVLFLLNLLKEQGLAEPKVMGGDCEILPSGYIRLDEMRHITSESSQGFVAMWFDDLLTEAYTAGLQANLKPWGSGLTFQHLRLENHGS